MDFSSYKEFLKTEYPSAYNFLQTHSWKPVFFNESFSLNFKSYQQIEKIVQSLFQLKNKVEYQRRLSSSPSLSFTLPSQNQDSVLMAYDFHLEGDIPKLIEVNTNASAFLLLNSLYQFKALPYKKAKADLKESFQREWEKFNEGRNQKGGSQNSKRPQKVVLIDEDPIHQKMAVEFFMYKDLFQSMDWPIEILASQSLKADDKAHLYTPRGDRVDFIYNRSTDFYFENHPHLAKAYEQGACAISPHPREYYLLSDKDRLRDWFAHKDHWLELEKIKDNLVFSEFLNSSNKEQVWEKRKKYFFKIRRGYGGKQVYKGLGLSRKKFDELCELEVLIQEHIPPLKIKDSKGIEWKTDLRVYVYEDQIQQITARYYQGQLTNFREEGSGFSTVSVIKD